MAYEGQLNPTVNPNVGFKLGVQEDLQHFETQGHAKYHTAVHGTFYLTSDTHRLYVGNSDGTISPVNEGIIFVNNLTDLPAYNNSQSSLWPSLQGQFYYVGTPYNILCVASGNRWVQINPDTSVESFNVTVQAQPTDQTTKTTARVSYSITQGGGRSDITTSFTDAFGIKVGSSNLHLSVDSNDNVVLSCDAGDTYSLVKKSIANNGGVKVLLVNSSYDDNDSSTWTNGIVGSFDLVPDPNHSNTIVPTLSGDSIYLNGGGLNDFTFTISEPNSDGKIRLELTDTYGGTCRASIKPIIDLHDGSHNVGSLDNSGNLTFSLPVYTTTEVDNLIKQATDGVDAMYFAGTVGTGGTVSSIDGLASETGLKNGATFKVTTAVSNASTLSVVTLEGLSPKTTIEVGDLIILKGDEYQNTDSTNATTYTTNTALVGTLVPSTVHYIYVPSGDNLDIYYTPNFSVANSPSVSFTKSDGTETRTLTFAAGRGSSTASATPPVISADVSSGNKTINIDHAIITTSTPAATVTTSYNPSFTAVTGITTSNGHVTQIDTSTITVTPNKIKYLTTNATSVTNGIKLQDSIADDATSFEVKSNGVNFTSTSLTVAATAAGNTPGQTSVAAGVSIDLKWGTF